MPGAGASRQRKAQKKGTPDVERPAREMTLRELVEKYRSITGGFGRAAALSAFGLRHAETEQLFSVYDEDYHISRFFHFSESDGERFSINGFPVTHVSIDAEIEAIL
ncbi:MAG TPA: hypothetical protein VEU31_07890 [Candidatus Acidoferrales bacterium]|nr:hypothetical protein [Candidatus Acidoferrales bacterium]